MRAVTTRSPMRDVSPIHREFDELLSRFFGPDSELVPGAAAGRWMPPVESFVRDGSLVVRVDVPGVDPNALDISVEGDRLTIRGERKSSQEEEKKGRVYREVYYGSFERTMTLPWDVDADKVQASVKDGVLEVTMKAPEKISAKKIPIATH